MDEDTTNLLGVEPDEAQLYDMLDNVPMRHDFTRIVGNQLLCTSHGVSTDCPIITIKPTQVLERNAKGDLELIDKAPQAAA